MSCSDCKHVLSSNDEEPCSSCMDQWFIDGTEPNWTPDTGEDQLQDALEHMTQSRDNQTRLLDAMRERAETAERSLNAIDKELRGKVNDPRPPLIGVFGGQANGTTTVYGLVTGLLAERDTLKQRLDHIEKLQSELQVVLIGDTGYYVPEAVKVHIERVHRMLREVSQWADDCGAQGGTQNLMDRIGTVLGGHDVP